MKLLLVSLCLFSSWVHAGDLWLKVGEVRRLPATSGKAVRIGSRGILKVIDGESEVRVVALKPGVTPLVIGEHSYRVHVSFSRQQDFTQALRASVQKMMGITLELDTQPVSIGGTLLRFSDWQRIADLQS